MKTNIKPLNDMVLIRVTPEKEKTEGGLFLPINTKKTHVEGIIVAVGPGLKDKEGNYIPMELNIGDCVAFPKLTGQPVIIENINHIIMYESDVFGVLEVAD